MVGTWPRVPVVRSTDRCEHRDGETGARKCDSGGACRTVAAAVAQSKAGLRCSWIVRSHWWETTVISNLPSTDLDRVRWSVLHCLKQGCGNTRVSVCERMSSCEEKLTVLTIRHDEVHVLGTSKELTNKLRVRHEP